MLLIIGERHIEDQEYISIEDTAGVDLQEEPQNVCFWCRYKHEILRYPYIKNISFYIEPKPVMI